MQSAISDSQVSRAGDRSQSLPFGAAGTCLLYSNYYSNMDMLVWLPGLNVWWEMHKFHNFTMTSGFCSAALVCQDVPSVLWRCWLGDRKGIRPVKNWVVGCWHGYLIGARCKLAYGPADVFTFFVPAHLGSPGKGPLNGCCCCGFSGLSSVLHCSLWTPYQWASASVQWRGANSTV